MFALRKILVLIAAAVLAVAAAGCTAAVRPGYGYTYGTYGYSSPYYGYGYAPAYYGARYYAPRYYAPGYYGRSYGGRYYAPRYQYPAVHPGPAAARPYGGGYGGGVIVRPPRR